MEGALNFSSSLPALLHHPVCLTSSGDFLKAHETSPDGGVVLTSSESNFMASWKLPDNLVKSSLYYTQNGNVNDDERSANEDQEDEISLMNAVPIGEAIHDFKWYPRMSLANDASCCFVTCSRDHPVQLWDLNSGQLRGSYLGHNQLDELETSNSVAFNAQGDKIFSGSNRMIRCFDVSYPGKSCVSMATSKTKKDKIGQKGIISEIRFNPQSTHVYAAGSYAHSIGLYAEHESSAAKSCLMHISDLPFGVTCLRWSPCGNMLWVGGRKSDSIICYDIRNGFQEVGRITRKLTTHQRMQFSLDLWGNTIATGTEDGRLVVYDVHSFNKIYDEKISNNCVNGVSFHPFSSMLIASSGERNFDLCESPPAADEERNSSRGDVIEGVLSDSCGNIIEKWSELQVYGLHKNTVFLNQMYANYTAFEM